jgi:glucose-6-phosphate isomerase
VQQLTEFEDNEIVDFIDLEERRNDLSDSSEALKSKLESIIKH